MPAFPPTRTTRRTALGAGLLALGGCTLDTSGPSSPGGEQTELGDQEYDQRLVDQVAAEISGALATIERIAARFDLVAGRMAPLVALHHAHLTALGVTTAAGTASPTIGNDTGTALARLEGAEKKVQQTLATAAENVRSGQLARLLAGMSAGVEQHVIVLFPMTAGSMKRAR